MSRHGLILWRHADAGHALSEHDEDFARPLSARGRQQAARVSRWISARLVGAPALLCSPAPRAHQTAAALASDAIQDARLAPDTGVEAYSQAIDEALSSAASHTVVVVGHQPMLGLLAARLLGVGDVPLAFDKAACWWFRSGFGDGGLWTLDVVMHPDHVDPPHR